MLHMCRVCEKHFAISIQQRTHENHMCSSTRISLNNNMQQQVVVVVVVVYVGGSDTRRVNYTCLNIRVRGCDGIV